MTEIKSRLAIFEVAGNPDPDSTLPFLIRLQAEVVTSSRSF